MVGVVILVAAPLSAIAVASTASAAALPGSGSHPRERPLSAGVTSSITAAPQERSSEVTFDDAVTAENTGSQPTGSVSWTITDGMDTAACSSTSSSTPRNSDTTIDASCTVDFVDSGVYTVSAAFTGSGTFSSITSDATLDGSSGYDVIGSDWTPPSASDASLVAPFNECPAVGYDIEGCEALIILTDDGASVVYNSNESPTIDNQDDALVGIVNDSSIGAASVGLSSSASIFGFDGDELCSGDYDPLASSIDCATIKADAESFYHAYNTANDLTGSSAYSYTTAEGPGTAFTGYNPSCNSTEERGEPTGCNQGTLDFIATDASGDASPLAPGASTFFTLESDELGATYSVVLPQAITANSLTEPAGTPAPLGATDDGGSGAITYALTGGTASGCSISDTSGTYTMSADSAGTCEYTASVAAAGDYEGATSEVATITFIAPTPPPVVVVITPPPAPVPTPTSTLSIVASSESVTAGQSFTETAAVSGASAGDLVALSGVTFTYTGTGSTHYGPSSSKPTSAGTYRVTPSGGSVSVSPSQDASSYSTSINYVSGTLVIDAAVKVAAPPAAPAPRTVVLEPFAEGSYKLSASLKTQIEHLADLIKARGYHVVKLTGYTDNVFTPAFNAQLNANRASAVSVQLRADLSKSKTSRVTISVVPATTAVLAASNATASGRAKNRRVVATLESD